MEAHLTKDLYKIGTKDGIQNSLRARNQPATEGTTNIVDFSSIYISLRECVKKPSLFGGECYRRSNC